MTAIEISDDIPSPTRKILVPGATGPTGRHIVAEARRRGHEVTALFRTPGDIGSALDQDC